MLLPPTLAQYQALQRAYDHFNAALFEGKLPPCLITLRSSHRHYGYHHARRFVNLQGEQMDELGLHPGFFTLHSPEETLSTLVHEMVHHWQEHFGRPSKGNPHNREWAAKMRSVGLEPTSTGLPQGKDTGHRVSHYIRPDGPFLRACRELLQQGFALPWFDRHAPMEPGHNAVRQEALKETGVVLKLTPAPLAMLRQTANVEVSGVIIPPPPKRYPHRVKYQCSGCGATAWAKEGLDIRCGLCDRALEAARPMSIN